MLKNRTELDFGNTMLDTVFWSQMSADPNAYHEKYRAKVDLVAYDFVVMPMFRGLVCLLFWNFPLFKFDYQTTLGSSRNQVN